MKTILGVISSVVFLSLTITHTIPAWAEDAQTVMQKMEQEQAKRVSGVKYYVVVKDAVGTRSILLYERISNKLGYRLVPPDEIAQRAAGISDEARHWASVAARLTFGSIADLAASQGGVSLSGEALSAMNDAFAGLAGGEMHNKMEAQSDATKSAFDRKKFAQMAKWVALERFGDRWAHHLRATDINITQHTKDGSYTLKTADLFVDNKKYVPLKMRFDFEENKTNKKLGMDQVGNMFSVEKISSDYRSVGSLYEPFKEIMRINPGLGGQQTAEMEKAQKEMAKVKQQLAAMPPAQREMMEQMLGSQMQSMMKTVDNMAAGKGIEVESVVHSFVAYNDEEQAISRYLLEIKRSGLTPAKPQ